MEYGELSGTGAGSQLSGLTGGEVAFLPSHLPVFIKKGSFDKQVIDSMREFYDFFSIGIIIGNVRDIGDLLTGCNDGDLFREAAQLKHFFFCGCLRFPILTLTSDRSGCTGLF